LRENSPEDLPENFREKIIPGRKSFAWEFFLGERLSKKELGRDRGRIGMSPAAPLKNSIET
jgi:hypothetical protein